MNDIDRRRAAIEQAAGALEDMMRLAELETRSGSLTDRQQHDYLDARTAWGIARRAVPELPALPERGGPGWGDDDLDKVAHAFATIAPMVRSEHYGYEIRDALGASMQIETRPMTGNDAIREMLVENISFLSYFFVIVSDTGCAIKRSIPARDL